MSNGTVANERRVTFPDSIAAPATYLVTGTLDPAEYGLCLRLLDRYGEPDDGALVVSTTESAAETVDRLGSWPGQLGVIDAVSRRQYLPALYANVPTVYTPAPRDLERTVMALSELTSVVRPTGSRHLAIRSLTPSLSETNAEDVCRFLERVLGLRTGSGLAFVGVDYSAHEDSVVKALLRRVDGVLWAEMRSGGSIDVTVRSSRALPTP